MSVRSLKIVVVGNGMAGFRFVQELLQLAPALDVTVVGDEPGGAYNRARLPLLLDGSAREDSIALSDEGWYERHRDPADHREGPPHRPRQESARTGRRRHHPV